MLTEHGENPWRSRCCNREQLPANHCSAETGWEGREEEKLEARRRASTQGVELMEKVAPVSFNGGRGFIFGEDESAGT